MLSTDVGLCLFLQSSSISLCIVFKQLKPSSSGQYRILVKGLSVYQAKELDKISVGHSQEVPNIRVILDHISLYLKNNVRMGHNNYWGTLIGSDVCLSCSHIICEIEWPLKVISATGNPSMTRIMKHRVYITYRVMYLQYSKLMCQLLCLLLLFRSAVSPVS